MFNLVVTESIEFCEIGFSEEKKIFYYCTSHGERVRFCGLPQLVVANIFCKPEVGLPFLLFIRGHYWSGPEYFFFCGFVLLQKSKLLYQTRTLKFFGGGGDNNILFKSVQRKFGRIWHFEGCSP